MSLSDHKQSGQRVQRQRDTQRDPRDSPRDPNTEIRTVRRNWTSSSPSPPSPMMSKPEASEVGLKSGTKRRGLKAGRVGWGRVGVGDLWGRQRHPRGRWNCVEDSCAGQGWEEVPAPGLPLDPGDQGPAHRRCPAHRLQTSAEGVLGVEKLRGSVYKVATLCPPTP